GFREAIAEGFIKGPRLLISIVMISQTGGHGDCWVPAGIRLQKRAWLPSGVVDGPEEMRKMVRTLLMAGAEFIQVLTTRGGPSVEVQRGGATTCSRRDPHRSGRGPREAERSRRACRRPRGHPQRARRRHPLARARLVS